jgi:tetratricopeptide (TPR) repeat protein
VLREKYGASAWLLALAVAVLWTVHPLQTESVTYVVQRAESLMGLFYLLTLYCFIRGTESQRPGFWFACSIMACGLGMATKEVIVSAPLMVLLYDRTFIAGNFAEAWRRRWRWYAGLACTWLVAAWLVSGAGNRGGAAGFGTGGILWWQYALTQCWAIGRYLRLCVWPQGQVFDYGTIVFQHAAGVVPDMLILVALLAGTVLGLLYRPCLGFLGAWFFVILAPSSSVMPVATQTIAEHRMYLSLAAVVTLVVMGIYALLGRRSVVVFLSVAMGLGLLTTRRNEDYHSELSIWSDSVAKRPDNARAHTNLGNALVTAGRATEAIAQCEQALRIEPDYAEAHDGLGAALQQTGRVREAVAHYERALRLKPRDAEAHYNLGVALLGLGKTPEAVEHFEQTLRRKPYDVDTHYNLGVALLSLGKLPEATGHFEQVLLLEPNHADAHYILGVALIRQGKLPEAIGHFEQVLRLKPGYADAHNNLGVAFIRQGKLPEAIAHCEQALRIKPEYAEAHNNLGVALEQMGRTREAIGHYEQALRIQPDDAEARDNLARARAAQ